MTKKTVLETIKNSNFLLSLFKDSFNRFLFAHNQQQTKPLFTIPFKN